MRLRWKFSVLIAVPILGMVGIFVLGMMSFSNLKVNIEQLKMVNDDIQSMLNADRDGYQAQLSLNIALSTLDEKVLDSLDKDHLENIQQTFDRIQGPSERFTENMMPAYKTFQEQYEAWKNYGRNVIEDSIMLAGDNQQRIKSSEEAGKLFAIMREQIDFIGITIEDQLSKDISPERRMELEKALSLVLNGDRDAYQGYVARLEALSANSLDELKEWDASSQENIEQAGERVVQAATISGADSDKARELFEGYFKPWKEASRKTVTLLMDNFQANQAIKEEFAASEKSFNEMRSAIDQLVGFQEERETNQNEAMHNVIAKTVLIYIIVVIAVVLITVILALLISMAMLKSIKTGITATQRISNGDLTTRVEVKTKDEIGVLAETLRDMVDRLKNIMQQIKTASGQVTSGSQQLSVTAEQLSQGATEQAAAVEEVSSSMEEMSSNIDQNADNATETEKIAAQSAQDAEESGKAVMEAVDAMNQIAEKITIIEEIARQTNMLSLNASIEAARAGEHGKGFAVVAAEVGKLAARSKEAAGEISELSSTTVGVAQKARQMLEQLVPNIRKTADLVQEISAASREQSSGADQINTAIGQLDQVIQQNASASEEMASVAEELNSQAEELQHTINFFTIDEKSRQQMHHQEKVRMLEEPGGGIQSLETGEGLYVQRNHENPGRDQEETGIRPIRKGTAKPEPQHVDSEDFDRF